MGHAIAEGLQVSLTLKRGFTLPASLPTYRLKTVQKVLLKNIRHKTETPRQTLTETQADIVCWDLFMVLFTNLLITY